MTQMISARPRLWFALLLTVAVTMTATFTATSGASAEPGEDCEYDLSIVTGCEDQTATTVFGKVTAGTEPLGGVDVVFGLATTAADGTYSFLLEDFKAKNHLFTFGSTVPGKFWEVILPSPIGAIEDVEVNVELPPLIDLEVVLKRQCDDQEPVACDPLDGYLVNARGQFSSTMQCPDGYSPEDSLGGLCARFEAASQGAATCPALGIPGDCYILVAKGPYGDLACEEGVLTGRNCVIVGDPPVEGPSTCPVSSIVFEDGDECYSLVGRKVGAGTCDEDAGYFPFGSVCKINNTGTNQAEVAAFLCPAPSTGETVTENMHTTDGTSKLESCEYFPDGANGDCPLNTTPDRDDGTGDCRKPVTRRPGAKQCAEGFGLVSNKCIRAENPTSSPGRHCPAGSTEDDSGGCRKPVADSRGRYFCEDPNAALNGKTCVWTAAFTNLTGGWGSSASTVNSTAMVQIFATEDAKITVAEDDFAAETLFEWDGTNPFIIEIEDPTPPLAMCLGAVVTIDMRTGASGVGTEGDDVILGTSGADVIRGMGGDDRICALGGDDVVNAGPGDDAVAAGAGADKVYGLSGHDDLRGGAGDDVIRGGGGRDQIRGNSGDDDLAGNGGDDMIRGHSGDDLVLGNRGADDLYGDGDDDEIVGGPGADTMRGGTGNDELRGQDGNDLLRGGPDNDRLFGGADNDQLISGAGIDRIFGGPGTDSCIDPSPTDTIGNCETGII